MELCRDATGQQAKLGKEKYWDRDTERWISKGGMEGDKEEDEVEEN
jgi:hypothetical protein